MIGGEGEANPAWMEAGSWLDMARSEGAVMLLLEHRYYGHVMCHVSCQCIMTEIVLRCFMSYICHFMYNYCRYYGQSHPTPDMSVKNLVWLSSRQALADLAHFITQESCQQIEFIVNETFAMRYLC